MEEMVLMEIGFRFGNLSPVAPRHILVMGESLCRKWTHHRPKVPPHSLWTHIFHFCQKHKKIVSLKIFSLVCQYKYLGEHLVGSGDYSKKNVLVKMKGKYKYICSLQITQDHLSTCKKRKSKINLS